MIIDIACKSFSLTPTIREQLQARIDKLERYQVPLISPQFILSQIDNKRFKVEAKIGIPNSQLFATVEHQELAAGILALGQKLERQLRKYQEKPIANRQSQAAKLKQQQLDIDPTETEITKDTHAA